MVHYWYIFEPTLAIFVLHNMPFAARCRKVNRFLTAHQHNYSAIHVHFALENTGQKTN